MALVVQDRVQETASAPGTGTVTLLGAVTGYQTFSSSIGNGNTTYYTIADQAGANWEVGIGTVGAGTLARTTVLSSSNSGSLVNFSSGTQNVFCTYPAGKAVYQDDTGAYIPASPVFTGTAYLGGTSSTQSLRVTPVASAVNYINVFGRATGAAPYLQAEGSDTNIDLLYSAKGTGAHVFYSAGSSFTQQFNIAHTASAVNYLQVTGSTTGNDPTISAVGTDTNIDVQIVPKGTGGLRFAGPLLPNNLAGTSGQVLTSAGAGAVPTWTTPAASNAISNGTSNVTIASSGGSVTTSVGGVSAVVTVSSTGTQDLSIGVGTAPSGTTGEIRATNNVTAYYSSDRRLKENIQTIPDALDKVDAIGGKTFDWTDKYIAEHGGADGYFVQKSDFGVIAQDVQAVFPQAVRTRDDGTLAVDYEKLVAVAFAAIVELRAEVKSLR